MIPALLSRYWPALGIALALLAGWLYVHHLQEQVARIPALEQAIVAEKVARERDVAGLTALSSGLAKAASDTKKDQTILAETIDAQHSQPVSSGLANLLGELRRADASGNASAGRTGR
jgi:hypothetical protein